MHRAFPPAEHEATLLRRHRHLRLPVSPSYAPADQQAQWREKLNALNSTVEDALKGYDATRPEKIAPALAKGLGQTNELLSEVAKSGFSEEARYNMTHELTIKQRQFNVALQQALGLSLMANCGRWRPNPAMRAPWAICRCSPLPRRPWFRARHSRSRSTLRTREPKQSPSATITLSPQAGPGWSVTCEVAGHRRPRCR